MATTAIQLQISSKTTRLAWPTFLEPSRPVCTCVLRHAVWWITQNPNFYVEFSQLRRYVHLHFEWTSATKNHQLFVDCYERAWPIIRFTFRDKHFKYLHERRQLVIRISPLSIIESDASSYQTESVAAHSLSKHWTSMWLAPQLAYTWMLCMVYSNNKKEVQKSSTTQRNI